MANPSAAAAAPTRPFKHPTLRPHIYAAQSLLSNPLNPPQPPPPPPPQAALFSANRFQMRSPATMSRAHPTAMSRPHLAADQAVTVANPAGYIRNSSPAAVMTYAGQARPHVFSADQTVHAAVHAGMRPPQLHLSSNFAAPRQVGVVSSPVGLPKGVPAANHPKVASIPTISSASEFNNSKDRDKSREDTVITIHGRKVKLSDGGSGSLYALCRSWVRNGLSQEHQLNFGDGVKLLPRPLPASIIDSETSKNSEDGNEAEESDREEFLIQTKHGLVCVMVQGEHDRLPLITYPDLALNCSDKQLSTSDLLEGLVRRSKRVRAQFRKERVRRIARYKQRLSLLLPPSNEMGRSDAAPGS